MTVEASSTPHQRGRWLLAVALVAGGLLFLGQYLALAVMYGLRLLGSPTMPIATLDFAYLYPLGLLFSNPVVFWVSSVLVLGLTVLAWVWGHPGRVARVALLLVMLAVVETPPGVALSPGGEGAARRDDARADAAYYMGKPVQRVRYRRGSAALRLRAAWLGRRWQFVLHRDLRPAGVRVAILACLGYPHTPKFISA